MNDSENKNPNQYLIKVGVFLILVGILSKLLKSDEILFGMAVIIRIMVLFWMPIAAKNVKRNAIGWTLFAFVAPPIAFIVLGSIGFNPEFHNSDIFQQFNVALKNKIVDLKTKLDSNEISEEEYKKQLSEYKLELSDHFKDNYYSLVDEEEFSHLNHKLEKKGYVLDENSDVFVEVNDKCPGCGAAIKDTDEKCPECGLSL